MRKTYAKAFKIQVCQAILAGDTTVGATAKHYDIARPIVSRWLAEYQRYGQEAFTGKGNRLTDQAKLYALEQENARLREENIILKKFREFAEKQKP